MAFQYKDKMDSGFDQYPLTGRQFVHLKRVWLKVGTITAKDIQHMARERR